MSSAAWRTRPTVLVVDPDPAVRRLLRVGLELDGARVVESSSAAHAREVLADRLAVADVTGLIVADHLAAEVRAMVPQASIVVTGEGHSVRGDVQAVIDALNLPGEPTEQRLPAAVELVRAEAAELAAAWQELCQWDPLLPPDLVPPAAEVIVRAVADALGRPQPLGWGPDPEVEGAAEVFAVGVESVEVAVGELVCLREVLRRRLTGALPSQEQTEVLARLDMIVDRAMGVAVSRVAARLEQQAYVDSLTGLLNRRALDRDLRREAGRASRHGRSFVVVVLDVDGLKTVNDCEGHAAGDRLLQGFARALQGVLRVGDAAYRIGGDEFVLILPEITGESVEAVLRRLAEDEDTPGFGWGAATFPDDGEDPELVLRIADERFLAYRRAVRST